MELKNLYAQLPDAAAYLKKLGMLRPDTAGKEYLDRLIGAHQKMIPWGNLEVCVEHHEISLEIPEIFDKVIVRGREAYCVELNALFYALIQSLGYDVYACQAKVIEGPEPYVVGHRGTIVRLNGKEYYADVGFGGPMPAGLIELDDGRIQNIGDDSYQIIKLEGIWWELRRRKESGDWYPMIRLQQTPTDLCDFVPISHYTCCHTQRIFNHFTDELLMNIRTEDGYASLTNRVLKVKKGTIITETILNHEEEIGNTLVTIFRLPESVRELIRGKIDFLFQ